MNPNFNLKPVPATGASLNPIDHRDLSVTADVNGLPDVSKIKKFRHAEVDLFPVLNQVSQPACVGHAESMVKAIIDYKETGNKDLLSPRFLYGLCKIIDGMADNPGTFPRIAGKILVDTGVCKLNLMPNDVNLSLSDYIKVAPTEEQKKDAEIHKVKSYGFTPADLEMFLATIYKNPVGITLLWNNEDGYRNYYNYRLPAPTNPQINGLHRVFAFGFERLDNGDVEIECRNSHGEDAHKEGRGNFKFLWSDYRNYIYDIMPYIDAPSKALEDARKQPNTFSYEWTRNLSRSTNGNAFRSDILALQTALTITGDFYNKVKGDQQPTGGFYAVTEASVIRYQARKGIKQTGIVGPLTRASLNAEFSKKKLLTPSQKCYNLIKEFEGLHDGNKNTVILEPKDDGVGNYTLGWGAIYDKDGKRVNAYTPAITLQDAENLLKRDVERFAKIVNDACYNLNQNQFDALVSFCYNLGSLKGLESKINDKTITRNDFMLYVYAFDKNKNVYVKLQGLINRRSKESDLFFTKESLSTVVYRLFTSHKK